ncbi:hypothetical protein RPMA_14540 [Tardiphaga alba]|uniref:Uncharacterized protein n=1 Tax=Tardiphaga alba TaxID=340268 RepID=A0ABX8A842_9BRAD|nr:hypothetical protein [Tardiphaga alba]QUS39916.1 hypothetical protein RPMA_14540 [Tardiphaga alba]
MASWKEERDRLVAQTLAFVQQVTAAHPAAAQKLGLHSARDPLTPEPDAELIDVATPGASSASPAEIDEVTVQDLATGQPNEIPAAQTILASLTGHASIYTSASERTDIGKRVAAFKARQAQLQHERGAYYDHMQARIRASLRNESDPERL